MTNYLHIQVEVKFSQWVLEQWLVFFSHREGYFVVFSRSFFDLKYFQIVFRSKLELLRSSDCTFSCVFGHLLAKTSVTQIVSSCQSVKQKWKQKNVYIFDNFFLNWSNKCFWLPSEAVFLVMSKSCSFPARYEESYSFSLYLVPNWERARSQHD